MVRPREVIQMSVIQEASDSPPMRAESARATASGTFTIEPLGPFSWTAAIDVLRSWAPVRRFTADHDGVVRLAFALDGSFDPVGVRVRGDGDVLRGAVIGARDVVVDSSDVATAGRQVARMFGVDADGRGYEAMLRRNPEIERIEHHFHGLRPVAFPSPYEAAIWAVMSQRISMTQAERLQERLICRAGTTVRVDGVDVGCLPRPEALLALESLDGLPQVKVDRLRAVAGAALDGRLDPGHLRALGSVDGPALLRSIPGIGPFWSSGIFLRGCNIVDAFPDEPLAVAALSAVTGIEGPLRSADVERLTAPFAPFRMWVCFLLRVAASRGLVPGIAGHEAEVRAASRVLRRASAD